MINEGDDTDCLFIVITGKAQALRSDETGRQFVVNRFGPYDYFGEMSLFDRNARCANVITKTKCNVQYEFEHFFEKHRFDLALSFIADGLKAIRNGARRRDDDVETMSVLI